MDRDTQALFNRLHINQRTYADRILSQQQRPIAEAEYLGHDATLGLDIGVPRTGGIILMQPATNALAEREAVVPVQVDGAIAFWDSTPQ